MNKLALSAILIGGLLQTAGCVISSGGDGGGSSAGYFDVSWDATECPAGAAAEVIAMNVANDEPFVDIFNCSDGGGVTAPLVTGSYDVWVEVTSADGLELYAQSNAVAGNLSRDGEIANIDIPAFPMNDGYFALTWNLTDGVGELNCEDAIADGVSLLATLASTTDATDDIFDCSDYQGVTDPLPVGIYTISVALLDGEESLGNSVAREETISFGNELVDLGNFEFDVQ